MSRHLRDMGGSRLETGWGSSGRTEDGTLGGSPEASWITSTHTCNARLSCVQEYAFRLAAKASLKRALLRRNKSGVQSSGSMAGGSHRAYDANISPPYRKVKSIKNPL